WLLAPLKSQKKNILPEKMAHTRAYRKMKQAGTWGNTETPNGTVTVTISDDHNFDRQIIIPPIIFNGIAYSDPGSGNN
ncbi:hypothetical protein O5274_28045, partial [Escherichia coli]|nr:hypothetical protein [Escherichia coli]